jgi:hypothetical protein
MKQLWIVLIVRVEAMLTTSKKPAHQRYLVRHFQLFISFVRAQGRIRRERPHIIRMAKRAFVDALD